MGTALEKEWKRLLEKEEKMFSSAEGKKENRLGKKKKELTEMVEQKIPEKIFSTLN